MPGFFANPTRGVRLEPEDDVDGIAALEDIEVPLEIVLAVEVRGNREVIGRFAKPADAREREVAHGLPQVAVAAHVPVAAMVQQQVRIDAPARGLVARQRMVLHVDGATVVNGRLQLPEDVVACFRPNRTGVEDDAVGKVVEANEDLVVRYECGDPHERALELLVHRRIDVLAEQTFRKVDGKKFTARDADERHGKGVVVVTVQAGFGMYRHTEVAAHTLDIALNRALAALAVARQHGRRASAVPAQLAIENHETLEKLVIGQ